MLAYEQPEIISYSKLLLESFHRITGKTLLVPKTDLARELYEAPFVLVSHGTEASPVFRYANRAAQELWGYGWDEFTALESRLSAEPMEQDERQRLLERAARDGYVDDYAGIRIANNGRRFEIRDTILWNVVDEEGIKQGQAATFNHVKWL